MSLNLIVAIEQEDHNNTIRPMCLPRVAAGLTHSAVLGIGHTLDLSGIHFDIVGIYHKHQAIGSDIAPGSSIHASAQKPLMDYEIEFLMKNHGLKDM